MLIKIYRLASGEIIMGDETSNCQELPWIEVKRPVCLVLDNDAITMALWLPHNISEPVSIHRRHVVAEAPAARGLANEYCEKCGGVVIAGADALAALD